MKQTRIENVNCEVHETNETEYPWVGRCEELGISVQARNLDELKSVFEEAVELLIADLVEEGQLHEFLTSRGWKTKDMPNIGYKEDRQIPSIPWKMIAEFDSNDGKKAFA